MSNPVSITASSNQPRRRADVVTPVAVVGVAAGITGYAAARMRQRRRTDVPQGVSDKAHSAPIAGSRALTSPVMPQGYTDSGTGTDTRQEDAAVHRVDLKQAVVRRPGVVVALTAVVVAVVTWAVTVLATGPGSNDPTPISPPPAKLADPMPKTDPMPLIERSTRIPMSDGGESTGRCTADGVCTGHVFNMDLGGDSPWVVTGVGYRPLEILPGRRVTRLRWELRDTELRSDRDTVAFTQTSDAPDPDMSVTYARVRVDGLRAMRITAVVEASIPAPGAVAKGLGPFEVYGYTVNSSSGDAEFPTRATVDDVRWRVAPFTVSPIAIVPGLQAAQDSGGPEGPSR